MRFDFQVLLKAKTREEMIAFQLRKQAQEEIDRLYVDGLKKFWAIWE